MATAATKLQLQPTTTPDLFSSPGKRRAVLSLLLGLLVLTAYNPVTRNGFVNFDDPAYVTGNPHIQSGLTWGTVGWAFTSTEQANWHPLTWLSHALDYQLFHLKPAGHHYDSTLLHALCAILLFLFLEAATRLAARSAVVAALFAVHPLNVESVAWISERKNVLCTVFFLLGLCAYEWYARRPSVKRYMVVFAAFVLGLMSKPMVITFPCVLMLVDFWPLRRVQWGTAVGTEPPSRYEQVSFTRSLLEKVPLFALTVASAVITMIAQRGGGAVRDQYSFWLRAANAAVSYVAYLGKVLWPANLAAMYPFPRLGLPAWKVAVCAAVILAITAAVFSLQRKRYLVIGWLWFLGTLVPVIGLVQVGEQAMADRYAYIPFIGLFVCLIWGIADLAAHNRVPARHLISPALLAIAVLAILGRTQIGYWHDSITLWSHTLAVTQNNFVAEDNLGAELIKQGDLAGARAHFQAAANINPQDAFSQLDLGVCEKRMGDVTHAVFHYQAALKLSANATLRSTALNNLASVYRSSGNYVAARQNYETALRLDPNSSMALIGLGLVEQKLGDLPGAINYYSRLVTVEPSDVAYLLLGQALAKSGQSVAAQAAYENARKMSSDPAALREAVDRVLAE